MKTYVASPPVGFECYVPGWTVTGTRVTDTLRELLSDAAPSAFVFWACSAPNMIGVAHAGEIFAFRSKFVRSAGIRLLLPAKGPGAVNLVLKLIGRQHEALLIESHGYEELKIDWFREALKAISSTLRISASPDEMMYDC